MSKMLTTATRIGLPSPQLRCVGRNIRSLATSARTLRTRVPTPALRSSILSLSSAPFTSTRKMSHHVGESTVRPEADKVLQDIADYVHNYKVDSDLAFETARLCLIDTLGCGLEALRFPECANLLGPVVEGTTVPNGTRSPWPS